MSPVLATTRRPPKISVRVLRALRDTHEDMVYLWERSLTLPQAPPRASRPTSHGCMITAQPPSVRLSEMDQRLHLR